MNQGDLSIIIALLVCIALFIWILVYLISKHGVNKLNLEISEWLKLEVERDSLVKDDKENIFEATAKRMSEEVVQNNDHMKFDDMWEVLVNNINRILVLFRNIKKNNLHTSNKFPITTETLKSMKRLRERYNSLAVHKNVTHEELVKLTTASNEIIEILTNIEQKHGS